MFWFIWFALWFLAGFLLGEGIIALWKIYKLRREYENDLVQWKATLVERQKGGWAK